MKFGYARVSKFEQNLDLQLDALFKQEIKVENIYTDKISRASDSRLNLEKLKNQLREGDELIVWKLDRICGSIIQLVKLLDELEEKKVAFRSIMEPFIDTTDKSSHRDFITKMFGLLAEFERNLIIERTKAGLEAARKRGKVLGPPRGLSKKAEQTAILAEQYYKKGTLKVDEILDKLKISRGSYYKYLRHRGVM